MKNFWLAVVMIVSCAGLVYWALPKPEKTITYLPGVPDTVKTIDSIPYKVEVPFKDIQWKYKTDTIHDTLKVYVESVFTDSTEDYKLTVTAYSPLPVERFTYEVLIFNEKLTVTITDTMVITNTVEVAPTWMYYALGIETLIILFK